MPIRTIINHVREGEFGKLWSKIKRWTTFQLKYIIFGIERALLTDRQWFQYTIWRNRRGVKAAADPRQLRYVDPTEITRESPFESQFWFRKFGAVRGGDWDIDTELLSERFDYIWEALEARYIEEREWSEISLVQEVLAGNERWKLATGDEVWEWVASLDEVYESIQTDGYLSSREILDMSFDEAAESNHNSLAERFSPVANESLFYDSVDEATIFDWIGDIQVDIGRNGEIIQHEGRHRLWFAQQLNVDEIPVCVIVRHEKWQELRDEIAAASSVEKLSTRARLHLDHPDMIDVGGSLETSSEDPK